MKLRKIILSGLTCLSILTMCLTGVHADEATKLEINGGEAHPFVEVFKVENGVTYFPIRLAFDTFKNEKYEVQVVPSMTLKNIRIAVVKTDEVTGAKSRRLVFVNWEDDVINEAATVNGRIEFYEYTKDSRGNNELLRFRPSAAMTNALIFSTVDENGGQRAFMSFDDFNKMVQFLIDDDAYSVTIK